MKENLTEQEANVFYYLVDKLKMTHKECVKWAYSRYDDGVLEWIEKLALSDDLEEVKEILRENFQIKPLSESLLVGEIAMNYFEKEISANSAVRALFDLVTDLEEWNEEEKSQVYIMDDYYDWHENPDSVVVPILEPFLKKYEHMFKSKFGVFNRHET